MKCPVRRGSVSKTSSRMNPHRFRIDWLASAAALTAVAGLVVAVLVCMRLD
jgi:hypothetical protein